MGAFDAWIGREERSRDRLDEALAWRWCGTFDLPFPDGGVMPQGIHWCFCTPSAPTSSLGPDGHPRRDGSPGSFLPPIPLPRRMWAGSSCRFHAPLAIGAEVERVSRIAGITEKQGSSGPLAFVKIAHETRADGVLALRETQTLVYREAPPPGSPPAPPEPSDAQFDASGWDRIEPLTPSPELLFRYSALTFNTHRIHYDADYVRDVENYRGLVVHGPLMASLLLQLAAQEVGGNTLASFAFRGLSPAIAGEGLVLAMRGSGDAIELGVFAVDGRQVMTVEAST